eukprot:991274-Pyramimonas_sp.AAC.1
MPVEAGAPRGLCGSRAVRGGRLGTAGIPPRPKVGKLAPILIRGRPSPPMTVTRLNPRTAYPWRCGRPSVPP